METKLTAGNKSRENVEMGIAQLKRFPQNSRTHTKAQIDSLVKSIKEFGGTNPLLIDEGDMLIAGHARLEAAEKAGLATVPCVRLLGLTEAQKPVDCMRKPMLNSSVKGDVIYDPFLGSGTSIIAAETCGRICYGMELNPAYVDVIVKRWQSFTGKIATLESTGEAFG